MYRPEGWEILGEHPCGGDGCLQCRDYANKEAGADAMLEGLKKNAKKIDTGDELALKWESSPRTADELVQSGYLVSYGLKGHLVFIEEDGS